MSFRMALREIESTELNVRINVVTDLQNFLRSVNAEEAVITLFRYLDQVDNQKELINHVVNLVRGKTDPRYENPYDVALAIYLWLLSLKNFEIANLAAQIIAELPRAWWATRLAFKILNGEYKKNDAEGWKIIISREMAQAQEEQTNVQTYFQPGISMYPSVDFYKASTNALLTMPKHVSFVFPLAAVPANKQIFSITADSDMGRILNYD
jgi:hypothetical protein